MTLHGKHCRARGLVGADPGCNCEDCCADRLKSEAPVHCQICDVGCDCQPQPEGIEALRCICGRTLGEHEKAAERAYVCERVTTRDWFLIIGNPEVHPMVFIAATRETVLRLAAPKDP